MYPGTDALGYNISPLTGLTFDLIVVYIELTFLSANCPLPTANFFSHSIEAQAKLVVEGMDFGAAA
jgi:hypothetical protein